MVAISHLLSLQVQIFSCYSKGQQKLENVEGDDYQFLNIYIYIFKNFKTIVQTGHHYHHHNHFALTENCWIPDL